MRYQDVAANLAAARAKAKQLPKRFTKSTSLSSLRLSLQAALTAAFLVYAAVLAYVLITQSQSKGSFNLLFNFQQSLSTFLAMLIVSLEYALWAFILVFPLPTVLSFFSSHYRETAKERLLKHRYFFVHVCLATWFTVIVIYLLVPIASWIIAGINSLFGSQWNIHLSAHFSTSQWLGLIALAGILYEGWLLLYRREMRASVVTTRSHFKLWLGKSTGLLAKRQHGAGLTGGQNITLELEDAAKNILIFGGIGSGKTSCAISPLLLQLLDQGCGGLVFDIKGDFHLLVTRLAEALGKAHRVVRLGIDGIPLNLIEGTLPEMATSFLKSAFLAEARSRGESAFWTDQATNLCTAVLGLLIHLPERYNLKDMYDYIFNPTVKAEIKAELELIKPALDDKEMQLFTHYQDSIEREFESFNEKTRNDIRATVTQVLMPFRNPRMTDAFCKPSDLNFENMLEGTVYLLNLPLSTHGIAARVVYTFIKLRFFNLMQNRLSMPAWNQDNPVFFMCDEYQDIVTGNTGGLSDLNFWDKSRSSKTIGIIASQSMSSFHAAIGDSHISNAVLQNFRQKICFSTEDQATFNYFTQVAGMVEIEKHTVSKQHGSSSRGWEGGSSNSHRSRTETISYVKEPVIDAQLMRNLKPQQAIAILNLQNYSCDDVLDMQAVR